MPEALHLRLRLPFEWERIERVRRSVYELVSAALPGLEPADSVSTATAELLENAIKYGAGDAIDLELSVSEGAVRVRVTNSVEAGSGHPEALERRLAYLHSHGDSETAYLTLLEKIYANPEIQDASTGLGLARVWHECGCELSARLGERVEVIAERALGPSSP